MSATPTHSLNPSSSSTGSPTPLPSGRSSKAGAIAGGVAGGIAAITIVIAAIFYLRRRSQATSAASAGVGASQSQQPLSDEIVSPSSSGSPTTMKFYVRDFVSRVALVCPHVSLPSYSRTPRTRMTRLRSRGTKVVRTRRTSLIKHLCHRTSGLEAVWATRRPRYPEPWDIAAIPLSDLVRRSPRRNPVRIAFLLVFPSPEMPLFRSRLYAVLVSLIKVLLPQGRLTRHEHLTTLCDVLYCISFLDAN
jgi:hypothetical protein